MSQHLSHSSSLYAAAAASSPSAAAYSAAASTLVTALRFDADGGLLAVGCDDGAVLLTGDRLRQWRSGGGRVVSLS